MATTYRTDVDAPILMTVVSKDGTEIAFWRSGSGPSVVLVHGSTSDHTAWDNSALWVAARRWHVHGAPADISDRSDGPIYSIAVVSSTQGSADAQVGVPLVNEFGHVACLSKQSLPP